MSSYTEYSTINSSDGYSFIVESRLIPANFVPNLPYESQIV